MNKKLFLVLLGFVIVAAGGIFLLTRLTPLPSRVQSLMNRSASPSPVPAGASTSTAPAPTGQDGVNPKLSVQKFYQWYFGCSKAGTCNFEQQPTLIDKKTVDELTKKARGYNPIVCSQNAPETFIVDRSTQTDSSTANVIVIMNYLNSPGRQLTVTVTKGATDWKITNITCPS